MARRDGIFPGESRLAGGDGKVKVYRMEFADGWGTMTAHAVMDGVTVIFNDFHTACGIQEEARCPGMVEINHCLAGRFECTMPDGRTAWLGPCDFAVSDMGRPPVESRFTQGLYQGISLVLDIRRASVSLQQMLGGEAPDLEALFEGLFESCSFLLLRSEPKIQHIFSELYHVPSEGQNAYYRLKTGELMLFLQERRKQMRRTGSFYYGMDRGRRVQADFHFGAGGGIWPGRFHREKVFPADVRGAALCLSEAQADGGGRLSAGQGRAERYGDRGERGISERQQIFRRFPGYLWNEPVGI